MPSVKSFEKVNYRCAPRRESLNTRVHVGVISYLDGLEVLLYSAEYHDTIEIDELHKNT